GRKVEGGVVDRNRPVDSGERVEGRAFGGSNQLGGPMRRPGERDGVAHTSTQTVTGATVKIFLQYILSSSAHVCFTFSRDRRLLPGQTGRAQRRRHPDDPVLPVRRAP